MWKAFIPVLLLAFLLVAPRRGGRPVGGVARAAAAFVLVWGGIAVLLGLLWNELIR